VGVRATFLRHPTLRWLIPLAVVGGISLTAAGVFSAQASPNLPPRTAAQLLADIETAQVNGMSGTIVANADLGLPNLPNVGGGSASSENLLDLLRGSHTARVWYAGPTKQRIALLDAVGETDVFHNGTDLWQWSSADKTAIHTQLPNGGENLFRDHPTTLTPEQLAKEALDAIDPSTKVDTDANRRVADRAAYELVLTPKDTTSRIGSVHIAVDGEYKIPVGVQVFARGAPSSPALDVSFTRLSFRVPGDAQFSFTPPSGAHVQESVAPEKPHGDKMFPLEPDVSPSHPRVTTIGTGWTTVVETDMGSDSQRVRQAQEALGGLTRVSGTWGSGYLFDSKLVTALLTDDGRLFAGAVDPQVLYAAAHK
jgi:outer membrane lipoprotein-sorting protein